MKTYLKKAAKAWAGATLNVSKFAEAYYDALYKFGAAARDAFEGEYPMFGEREWRRLWLIGSGELLPQFFFKSDSFIGKLLKMPGSMNWQKSLVGMTADGKIRVDRGHGPEMVTLSDLTRKEDRALMLLMRESDSSLSAEELRTRYKRLVAHVNKSVKSRARRGSREILLELVEAIRELESLRDDELDYMEEFKNYAFEGTPKYYDKLLGKIQRARNKVRDLCREATGDNEMEV